MPDHNSFVPAWKPNRIHSWGNRFLMLGNCTCPEHFGYFPLYTWHVLRCDAATRQAKKGVRPGDIVRLIKVCPSVDVQCFN